MNKLLSYLPPYLREYEELKCITDSEYPEIEYLNNGIKLVLNNNFIRTLSPEGCERWEFILNIKPPKNSTLEERRIKILEKMNSMLPYTERSFQGKLDSIYGEGVVTINIDYGKYEIWFDTSKMYGLDLKELQSYSRKVIPANMCIRTKNIKDVSGDIFIGGIAGLEKPLTSLLPEYFAESVDTEIREYAGGIVRFSNCMTILPEGFINNIDILGNEYMGGIVRISNVRTEV